jgi:hypothetical protein
MPKRTAEFILMKAAEAETPLPSSSPAPETLENLQKNSVAGEE